MRKLCRIKTAPEYSGELTTFMTNKLKIPVTRLLFLLAAGYVLTLFLLTLWVVIHCQEPATSLFRNDTGAARPNPAHVLNKLIKSCIPGQEDISSLPGRKMPAAYSLPGHLQHDADQDGGL